MKPYSAQSNKGRVMSRDDIHHATHDGGKGNRDAKAKSQRKAARQEAKSTVQAEIIHNHSNEQVKA